MIQDQFKSPDKQRLSLGNPLGIGIIAGLVAVFGGLVLAFGGPLAGVAFVVEVDAGVDIAAGGVGAVLVALGELRHGEEVATGSRLTDRLLGNDTGFAGTSDVETAAMDSLG